MNADREIEQSSWPDALPHRECKNILLVSCGNTHMRWSLMTGYADGFENSLCWKTKLYAYKENNSKAVDPCLTLVNFIPDQARTIVFGSDGTVEPNATNAMITAVRRRIPTLYIYLVSTNPAFEKGLGFLFRDIPCRIVKLQAKDFIHEVPYDSLGVDRAASMRQALDEFAPDPVLVIDGGTALTWTSTDRNGKVVGGGISNGIMSKFLALHQLTGGLPEITPAQMMERIEQCEEKQEPLKSAANNTVDSMIQGVLRECTTLLISTINLWVATLGKDAHPRVILTGGDGEVYQKLLAEHHSYIIEEDTLVQMTPNFTTIYRKHLIFEGIATLLKSKMTREEDLSADDLLREKLLGQRVAKRFPLAPYPDGDDVYRGYVRSVERGNTIDADFYRVEFDDGDQEELDVEELHDALILFENEKEKVMDENSFYRNLQDQKVVYAARAARVLRDHSTRVKTYLEKQENEKKRKADPAAPKSAEKRVHIAEKPGQVIQEPDKAPEAEVVTDESMEPAKEPTTEAASAAESKETAKPQDPKEKTQEQEKASADPYAEQKVYLNKRMARYFGKKLYFGTVRHFTPADEEGGDLWRIIYDDSDQEDLELDELLNALKIYKKHGKKDPNSIPK